MTSVSAIIPTYNREEFLQGAIETVFQQTHANVEIVVVDDGSDGDYADQICADYPDVKLFSHTQNQGLSAARNTGIEHSTGEYIAFLDDDDRWHKEKLDLQAELLDKSPESGIATCLLHAVDPDGNLIRPESSQAAGDLSDAILRGNIIGTPSRVMVRRAAIEDVGMFDESLPTKQDCDFYIRVCQNWGVELVERPLCYRTVHESMSSSPRALERDKGRIIEKHSELMSRRGVLDDAYRNYHMELARRHLDVGNSTAAREHVRSGFNYGVSARLFALLLLSLVPKTAFESTLSLKRRLERAQVR